MLQGSGFKGKTGPLPDGRSEHGAVRGEGGAGPTALHVAACQRHVARLPTDQYNQKLHQTVAVKPSSNRGRNPRNKIPRQITGQNHIVKLDG